MKLVWQRVTHLPRTKTEGLDRSLPLSSNGKFGSIADAAGLGSKRTLLQMLP